mgnify:CR=1 FL=1
MDEKPHRTRRTPQEAKQLSYDRDGVNQYGENSKASRKAIPRFKARTHRTERHGEEAALKQVVTRDLRDDDDREGVDRTIAEARFHGRTPSKRKIPDLPLGLALGRKASREQGRSDDAAPRAGKREAVAREMAQYAWHRRKPNPAATGSDP